MRLVTFPDPSDRFIVQTVESDPAGCHFCAKSNESTRVHVIYNYACMATRTFEAPCLLQIKSPWLGRSHRLSAFVPGTSKSDRRKSLCHVWQPSSSVNDMQCWTPVESIAVVAMLMTSEGLTATSEQLAQA